MLLRKYEEDFTYPLSILPFERKDDVNYKDLEKESLDFSLKDSIIEILDLCPSVFEGKTQKAIEDITFEEFKNEYSKAIEHYIAHTKVRWTVQYCYLFNSFIIDSLVQIFKEFETYISSLDKNSVISCPTSIVEKYNKFTTEVKRFVTDKVLSNSNSPKVFKEKIEDYLCKSYLEDTNAIINQLCDPFYEDELSEGVLRSIPFTELSLYNILGKDYISHIIEDVNCFGENYTVNSSDLKFITEQVISLFGKFDDPNIDEIVRKEMWMLYQIYFNCFAFYMKYLETLIFSAHDVYNFADQILKTATDGEVDFNGKPFGEGSIEIVPVKEFFKTHDYADIINRVKFIADPKASSTEDGGMYAAAPQALQIQQMSQVSVDKITENYKRKGLQLQKIYTDTVKVKYNKLKSKVNALFFKRWYGRIPSMLQRYGGSARITENRMKGDPTRILLTSGTKYLQNMTNATENLFNEVLNLAKQVSSAGNLPQKLGAIKNFCKQYPIETNSDPKALTKQIISEATFRIATCIFQDNGIYGYTPEGIVENGKFPTCNHIVTSLFIDNAHEQAEELTVSDIFQSPDSITVFAHPEKFQQMEVGYNAATGAIVRNFNPKLMSQVHKNLDIGYKRFSASLNRPLAAGEGIDGRDDAGNMKKQSKAIDDGIVKAMDLIIDQKKRCIQCVGAMYEMSGRIANLAKRCVAALHQAEMEKGDINHNSGMRSAGLNATTARLNRINQKNNAPSVVRKTATGRMTWY